MTTMTVCHRCHQIRPCVPEQPGTCASCQEEYRRESIALTACAWGMDPAMAGWYAELSVEAAKVEAAKTPHALRAAYAETRRFFQVTARGGDGSACAAAEHARWTERAGFDAVRELGKRISARVSERAAELGN